MVIESNNDAIIQVKRNQGNLFNDCIWISKYAISKDVYKENGNHGNRKEIRKITVFDYVFILGLTGWELVKAVIKVDRHREELDTKKKCWNISDETAFYISTTKSLSAKDFCCAIRWHWGIENSNHYVKDEIMNEDKSRIRKNSNVFAILRSFALNIIRVNNVKNVRQERYKNCMNPCNILNYKGIREH